jgi:hypothetical protein
MTGANVNSDDLELISVSLESLREQLEVDLATVKQLPASEIEEMLRQRARNSQARAMALVARIVELREIVDSRRRTLERLRLWMRQVRGGARPQ